MASLFLPKYFIHDCTIKIFISELLHKLPNDLRLKILGFWHSSLPLRNRMFIKIMVKKWSKLFYSIFFFFYPVRIWLIFFLLYSKYFIQHCILMEQLMSSLLNWPNLKLSSSSVSDVIGTSVYLIENVIFNLECFAAVIPRLSHHLLDWLICLSIRLSQCFKIIVYLNFISPTGLC